jgi:hypothetical protein
VLVVTPLGIRFWDAARDVAVTSGLVVRARPEAAPGEPRPATPTRSGVYAFFGLPGLRSVEYPPGDGPTSPPSVTRFIVDVADAEHRFVPVAFLVDVPYAGIFPIGLGASLPGTGAPGFYLFSAATRQGSTDLAVIRATLVERLTGAPAAHAVLEATLPDGGRVLGLADADGQVAVLLPYPRFATVVGSPPVSAGAARQPPEWPLAVRVRYGPAGQTVLRPDLPPELGSLLAQPFVQIWPGASGPPDSELATSLVLGRELIVRTDDGSTLLVG